jgi:hypothetical protein
VYKKGDRICLLNVTYKAFAKIIYDPTLTRPFSMTRLGSNLFIDLKAAYETIIRNEVYVGMSELNFPTKLIRLTKATLTIVMSCVKIQNDCSESFETRQGLRQGDVLPTQLFNVVLVVIVRRVNLQTAGTIYNKKTQLLAYANDIDIVGRSQSAVQNAYLALEGEAAKVGLKINEQKTKYMIAARNDMKICDVGQSVAIGDKHFEVIKEFVYL